MRTAPEEALREEDSQGRLPPHLVAAAGAAGKHVMVEALLQAYPEAVDKPDNNNNKLPLHHVTPSVGVLAALLEAFPQSARESSRWKLPLNAALEIATEGRENVLAEAYEDAVNEVK